MILEIWLYKFTKICRYKVMYSFKCQQKKLKWILNLTGNQYKCLRNGETWSDFFFLITGSRMVPEQILVGNRFQEACVLNCVHFWWWSEFFHWNTFPATSGLPQFFFINIMLIVFKRWQFLLSHAKMLVLVSFPGDCIVYIYNSNYFYLGTCTITSLFICGCPSCLLYL